ncbi:MAG TPA: cell division protein, partial [Brevundimonas sp.]|nr:cell division protein [Brevundimonas sp.]
PGRLEALSRGAGLGPVDVHRQATEDSLPNLAPIPEPAPVVIVAPTPAPAAEPAPADAAAPAPAEEPAR